MTVFGAFVKAAVVGAAANALFPCWRAQCLPLLPPVPNGSEELATRDLEASMRLLDQGGVWSVETDDFQKGIQAATAQLQILRFSSEYVDQNGKAAPVMRLVGLFPGVSTDALHRRLTDVPLRLEWDSNYTFYEGFAGDFPSTLSGPAFLRPVAAVAKKRPHCEGDVCTLVPDVASSELAHGWFSHGVGSHSLRRFGIVDRLFQYERISTVFRLTKPSGEASAAAPLYDVLYSGSRRTRDAAAAASPALAAWLQAKRSSGDCEGVDVNFQHIVLIPLADANAQLLKAPEQLRRLCTMGSVFDETTAKLVYDVVKDTQQRSERGEASLPASLLVMTSANNVSVPTFLPQWMQKKISGSLSRKAYGQLMDACVKDEANRRL